MERNFSVLSAGAFYYYFYDILLVNKRCCHGFSLDFLARVSVKIAIHVMYAMQGKFRAILQIIVLYSLAKERNYYFS